MSGVSGLWKIVLVGCIAIFIGPIVAGVFFGKEGAVAMCVSAVDHMKFIGNLLDEEKLSARLDTIVSYDKKTGILFRT